MPKRYLVAFTIMFFGSIAGSFVAGNQAGHRGAKAGKTEVEKEASKIASHSSYLFAVSQVESSRKSCLSGNHFRRSVNSRTVAIKNLSGILEEFLSTAQKALTASASHGGVSSKIDSEAAESYLNLIIKLDDIKFNPIKTRNCKQIYKLPKKP